MFGGGHTAMIEQLQYEPAEEKKKHALLLYINVVHPYQRMG